MSSSPTSSAPERSPDAAPRAADGTVSPKARATPRRPTASAAASRVFAREAATKVADEGVRWVLGASEAGHDRSRPRWRRRRDRRHPASPVRACSPTWTTSCVRSTPTSRPPDHPHANSRRTITLRGSFIMADDRRTSHRHRRRRRRPSGRARRRHVLGQRHQQALQHQRGRPDRWDPDFYFDADRQAIDKTLLQDRWMGPGVGLGATRMATADPAEGERRDGSHPAVGDRRRPPGARRLRLPRATPRR